MGGIVMGIRGEFIEEGMKIEMDTEALVIGRMKWWGERNGG